MNDKIMLLVLKINQRYQMKVIQVFAATASYQDQEAIETYREIQNLIKEKKRFTIIMEDFNAKLGKKEDKKEIAMENFGVGTRNERTL